MTSSERSAPNPSTTHWRGYVRSFERPSLAGSVWQITTSVLPYVALWVAMYLSLQVSYWLTLPLTVVAAGFLVRTYIVFHDCAHSAFFDSRTANTWVGRMCGLLVFTPFAQWRHEHAMHHASAGDLDRRGTGDIATLTVREYGALSMFGRIRYRLYRNPFVLFGLGPLVFQIVMQRLPQRSDRLRAQTSKHVTSLALLVLYGALVYLLGIVPVVLILLPTMLWSGGAGIWLFYVQHQFEDAYWQRNDSWEYADAALRGSSYLRLPRVLQWFTGNIGLHHVHHLSSRVPNYRLQACHDANPIFHDVPTLTLLDGLRATRLKLWDEENGRLIGWRELRASRNTPVPVT